MRRAPQPAGASIRRSSLREVVAAGAERLDAAGVAFGQGTTDATQEAMWLAAHALSRPWDALVAALDEPVSAADARKIDVLVDRRITTRKPAAYLLNEAWLGPYRFYVDERVIVPRSFIAELLCYTGDRPAFAQNLGGAQKLGESGSVPGVTVLDLCTGSGCLAIMAAMRWPAAEVDAVDLSGAALAVAERNVADYQLGERVRLLQSDLFAALEGRTYDLILSNPPYVKAASMKRLPEEFRKEPKLALASGADGLDHTRAILARARHHLKPKGRLVVEIGHNRKTLERAYPKLPFKWPRVSAGAGHVFTLDREELP
ncbi:MAG TPA: 50S ribosomal protein L3 N(5)-glutamine methyltransferase [Usitatibacter sp.]|nr:50S ribosomal protein L3 N(5)-glutamine methyltransferase [Usitatibacter sp.]